ncbi:MAG: hypothetical protein NC489_24025 [Ruminococcus flavefaciens]|nr:hypothetical protein [Ruminococcus flavefaciens]
MTAVSRGRSLSAAYGRILRLLRGVVSNRGRSKQKTKDRYFRAGIFPGKCFHDRNYGGRLADAGRVSQTAAQEPAAVLVS